MISISIGIQGNRNAKIIFVYLSFEVWISNEIGFKKMIFAFIFELRRWSKKSGCIGAWSEKGICQFLNIKFFIQKWYEDNSDWKFISEHKYFFMYKRIQNPFLYPTTYLRIEFEIPNSCLPLGPLFENHFSIHKLPL